MWNPCWSCHLPLLLFQSPMGTLSVPKKFKVVGPRQRVLGGLQPFQRSQTKYFWVYSCSSEVSFFGSASGSTILQTK